MAEPRFKCVFLVGRSAQNIDSPPERVINPDLLGFQVQVRVFVRLVVGFREHGHQGDDDSSDIEHEEEAVEDSGDNPPFPGDQVRHLAVLKAPDVRLYDPPDLTDVRLKSTSVLDRLRAALDRGDQGSGGVLPVTIRDAPDAAASVGLPEVDDRRLNHSRRDRRGVGVGDGGAGTTGRRRRRGFLVALIVGRPRRGGPRLPA